MQMRTHELQKLTVKELHKLAAEQNIENYSGLRKQELIIAMLEKQAKTNNHVFHTHSICVFLLVVAVRRAISFGVRSGSFILLCFCLCFAFVLLSWLK